MVIIPCHCWSTGRDLNEDAVFVMGQTNIEGYNGVIHVINKVVFPSTESAGDLLRKSGNYS